MLEVVKKSSQWVGKLLVIAFNPLPNNKILDWSKMKAFTDDKVNVNFILCRVQNTVGKALSPFPQCFQKGH